jgi:hypothetical protein
VTRDRFGQIWRQGDAEAGAEGAVVGQAAGEVAVHDDRGTGRQVPADVAGGGEQRGEAEGHAGLRVVPAVDLLPQRLVERGHGGDEYRSAGRRQQRRDGGLPRAA